MYAFGAAMVVLACVLSPERGVLLSLVAGIILAPISIGLFARVAIARKALVVLLHLSLIMEFYLASQYFDAMFGIVELPPGFNLGQEAAMLVIRSLLAVSILYYMHRPGVRGEFESPQAPEL